mmetsp:Transcript_26230/g.60950  ORF Transcript_26230/g.60950 Transcript_26230/m.60950 type:complete len:161 (-) Transcript_26230:1068-1550(-)
MGGSSSKPKDDFGSFTERIKAGVQDEIAKRAMLQREVEISVQIAKARDTVQIFGSAWLVLITGVVGARAMGHQVPTFAAIPVVVGGLVLGNMTDLAYGNKLQRVTREAERIMEHEKARFVPPKQAPFAKFYTEEEKAAMFDKATPVADLFPSSFLFPRKK